MAITNSVPKVPVQNEEGSTEENRGEVERQIHISRHTLPPPLDSRDSGDFGDTPELEARTRIQEGKIIVHIGGATVGNLRDALGRSGNCLFLTAGRGEGVGVASLHFANGETHLAPFKSAAALVQESQDPAKAKIYSFGRNNGGVLTGLLDAVLAARVTYAGLIDGNNPSHGQIRRLVGLPSPEVEPSLSRDPMADELRCLAKGAGEQAETLDRLIAELGKQELEPTLELERAVAPVIEEIQATGIRLRGAPCRAAVESAEEELVALRSSLSSLLGIDDPGNAEAVREGLARAGVHVDSADDLAQWLHIPGVKELLTFRRESAFVNDTGRSLLLAFDRSLDERVRGTWNQLGTETGRITCVQPNLLGVPRSKRGLFIPKYGCRFIYADYAACQVRIAAELAHDESFIELFDAGRDPHSATAAAILRIPEHDVTAENRDVGKLVNFRMLFGPAAKGLQRQLRNDLGLEVSVEEAEAFIDRFLQEHSGIDEWQRRTRHEMPGITRALGGRVTRFDPADRNVNSRLAAPIQGTEASMIKLALVLMAPRLRQIGAFIVIVHYDSVLVEAPISVAEDAARIVRDSMLEAMAHFLPKVRPGVSVETRGSWGA